MATATNCQLHVATNVVDLVGLAVPISTETGAGKMVNKLDLHVATDVTSALHVATKNPSTFMDFTISTELNLDTLHVATDSSTINSMSCPPDDMSVLTANDEPLGHTSNMENIPELTDVTVTKPPSS